LPAEVIDGVAIARAIRGEVARETAALIERGVRPGLAVVLVGEDPASVVYVRAKGRACDEAGVATLRCETLPSGSTHTASRRERTTVRRRG